MLGAEGVQNAVLTRLKNMVPTGIQQVYLAFDIPSDKNIIPLPKKYYSSALPESVSVDLFPFVVVTVTGTDGELSARSLSGGDLINEYQVGYNVTIRTFTLVPGANGQKKADIQAKRLNLAIREAMFSEEYLQVREGNTATVNSGRWSDNYQTGFDEADGVWEGYAELNLSITTIESLDRTPYIDTFVRLVGLTTYAEDPLTGEEIEDSRQSRNYPEPDVI